jgi:hypothetical protein
MIIDKSILSNVAMKQDMEVFLKKKKHHSMSLATYLWEPQYTNMAIKNPQNHFILTFRIFNLKFWQNFTNKKRVVTRDFFFNFVGSKCW